MKAQDLKPGMRITCDMGVFHPMDEICTVDAVFLGNNLFNDPVIRVDIRRCNGEIIRLVDYKFNDQITVQGE